MIRTILTPERRDIHLTIPEAYIGKPVEVTFLALEELENCHQGTLSDFFGLLPGDAYSSLKKHAEQARKEWDGGYLLTPAPIPPQALPPILPAS